MGYSTISAMTPARAYRKKSKILSSLDFLTLTPARGAAFRFMATTFLFSRHAAWGGNAASLMLTEAMYR